MDAEPLVLAGAEGSRWAEAAARALEALRLNQHFPPWTRLAGWMRTMALGGEVRLDPEAGLPTPREWVRLRVGRELAEDALGELRSVDFARLPAAEATRLDARRREQEALLRLEPLPARDVHVALRHVETGRASWLVRVDRFDLASATVARYTIIVGDRPGRHVGDGELDLRPTADFEHRLEVLSTQDAALAFAVLRDDQQMDVEEVVRGVVGPAAGPGGPEVLRGFGRRGPVVSACLERASLDVKGGRVDDPLAGSVVVPADRAAFGISRQRKWAAPESDAPALRAWLAARGSRNLVYAYAEVA